MFPSGHKATSSPRERLRFVVDAMLGRLARWLRVLGYDTVYLPQAEDRELIELARRDGRLLLTRDTRLSSRRTLRVIHIKDDRWPAQLLQLQRDLGLSLGEDAFSRCLVCNQVLEPIEAAGLVGQVPPYVLATQDTFRRCPSCRRIYWRGTHWQKMRQRLAGDDLRLDSPSRAK